MTIAALTNDPVGLLTFALLVVWFIRDQFPTLFKRQ